MHIGRTAAPFVLAATALAPAWAAVEGYTVVDGFGDTVINADIWAEQERVRTLTGTALRHIQRDVGSTASDSGSASFSFNSSLTRPTPVTQLRGVLNVREISLAGCPANSGATSRVRARVLGTFFNTGVRTPNSHVGDVLAQVWVERAANSGDAPGVLRVVGWVGVCLDAGCGAAQQIGSNVPLGTTALNTNVTVAVEWDRAAKTFNFLRDGGAASGSRSYAVSDTNEPSISFKSVGTRTEVANCTSTRTQASIDATFDTISVNAKAKP